MSVAGDEREKNKRVGGLINEQLEGHSGLEANKYLDERRRERKEKRAIRPTKGGWANARTTAARRRHGRHGE